MKNFIVAICILVLSLTPASAFPKRPKVFDRIDYLVGNGWQTVGDVNSDGIPDIVTLNGCCVLVLLGNGDGTFRTGPSSQVGPPVSLAGYYGDVEDVNGDGILDVLVVAITTNMATPAGFGVCFGNGDGTFQPAVFYQISTDTAPIRVIAGDFTRDGFTDVAVLAHEGVWLFTGTGSGTFGIPRLTPVGNGLDLNSMASADFNKDGNLDLAVTVNTGFVVLLGNGDGSFQTQTVASPTAMSFLAVGDLNRDGYPDVAASSSDGATALVFFNNGHGSFGAPSVIDLPGGKALAIGDVDGDGIADIVSAAGYVAFGAGGGTYQSPAYYPVFSYDPTSVVLADLTTNGRTDILANGSVLLNLGDRYFEDGERIYLTGGGNCAVSADWNGDGRPDLAVGTNDGIAILLGTGKTAAPFTKGTIIAGVVGCPSTGDFNGDGIPDLLVQVLGDGLAGSLECYLGKGDGTFTFASSTVISTAMGEVGLGDFNHDGKLDFALAGDWLALGNGDGTFQPPTSIPGAPGQNHDELLVGDVNSDGWPDLIIFDPTAVYIYVLVNNHAGGFTQTQKINFEMGDGVAGMVLADLNDDGNLDMIISSESGVGVFFYVGDGTGHFATGREPLDPPNAGSWLTYADVNGDGIPDIETLSYQSLSISLGLGKGAFAPPYYIGTGPTPGLPIFEGLHGQAAGLPDIIVPDLSGAIYVYPNITQ